MDSNGDHQCDIHDNDAECVHSSFERNLRHVLLPLRGGTRQGVLVRQRDLHDQNVAQTGEDGERIGLQRDHHVQ